MTESLVYEEPNRLVVSVSLRGNSPLRYAKSGMSPAPNAYVSAGRRTARRANKKKALVRFGENAMLVLGRCGRQMRTRESCAVGMEMAKNKSDNLDS